MTREPGRPTAWQAMVAFIAAFTGILGVGVVIARSGLPTELTILATPAVTLLVAVGAVRAFRLRPYPTLRLRPARNSHLLLTVPVALALFVVSDQLANLSRVFVPIDENLMRSMAELVRADGLLSWLVRLAGIGFGAALAEELLFRGVILSGLRSLGKSGAVLVSALLFTAMHVLPLPNYFVAGVVLGIAAQATGSILVPIAIHLFHNVAALLLFNLASIETLGDPLWTPPGILIPAVAILGIGLLVWARADAPEPAKETASDAPTEAREEPLLPAPPPGTLSITEDLREVPKARRRAGFLVLAAAMIAGLLLVGGLFGYLGYMTNPGPQRAAAIQTLRRISHEALTPEAAARGPEIDAAFATLTELNREGQIGFTHIWRTARVVAAATADGDFGERDVEQLLMTVGAIHQQPTNENSAGR